MDHIGKQFEAADQGNRWSDDEKATALVIAQSIRHFIENLV